MWRGVSTGSRAAYEDIADGGPPSHLHPRASLIRQMDRWDRSPILDVGVTRYVQGVANTWGTKPRMSRGRLAQHKMITLAEGNDMSSGLKWALLSGSAILMPTPSVDSWARESLLEPWVHYIPVTPDFSDLEDKARWCLDQLNSCHDGGQAMSLSHGSLPRRVGRRRDGTRGPCTCRTNSFHV